MNKSFDKISAELSAETDSMYNSYLESMRGIVAQQNSMLDRISQSIKEVLASSVWEKMQGAVWAAQKTVASYMTFSPELSAAYKKAVSSLTEQLKNLPVITITEARKAQLIEAFQQWGEYGWTIIPTASFALYGNIPVSKKEANKMALRECSKSAMERIFRSTAKMQHCKKTDYAEAIFDFEHRQYRSCALILFALIDGKLIRLQRASDLKGKRRAVGVRAIDIARNRADASVEEYMLITILNHVNLFACLATMFGSGNGFRQQPAIINRNFLDHGMLTRKVTRMDCLQLFLLYYNLLDLLVSVYK